MLTSTNMELERRQRIGSTTLTSAQGSLLCYYQGDEATAPGILPRAPASELPEAPLAQADYLSYGLCNMVPYYLRDPESVMRVQQMLLPERAPAMVGMEMAVRYLPMLDVSGDYYDFLPLHEGQAGLVVGDACGKGIGAALLMASVCVTVRAQVQAGLAAEEMLAHLNRAVYRDTPKHRFVTLIYGICDASTYTFTYSNAGHPPALHYQATTGSVRKLSIGGVVLGVFEDIEYSTESVSLGEGDALVLYTDGIIEASDDSDEVFGIDRLSEVVAAHGQESSEALAAEILTAASQFAHQGWKDDVTLMVVKRVGT